MKQCKLLDDANACHVTKSAQHCFMSYGHSPALTRIAPCNVTEQWRHQTDLGADVEETVAHIVYAQVSVRMYMPQHFSVDLGLVEHWSAVCVSLKPACTHSAVGDGVPSSLTLSFIIVLYT